MVFQPFLPKIEKDSALVGIEFAGDINGPANVVAELVVVHRGRGRSKTVAVGIARPGIRVQSCIAEVFISCAMELAGPGFGREANLSSRSAAVFRGVIGREDLDFL